MQIKTTFGYDIRVPDDVRKGEWRCVMYGGESDLGNAIAKATTGIIYYFAAGYKSVRITMLETCYECGGTGRVNIKRSRVMFATKPCKCKGKPFSGETVYTVESPDNLSIAYKAMQGSELAR